MHMFLSVPPKLPGRRSSHLYLGNYSFNCGTTENRLDLYVHSVLNNCGMCFDTVISSGISTECASSLKSDIRFPSLSQGTDLKYGLFSRRFSSEKCPTITVASFVSFFSTDYNITLIGPLFLQSKLLKLLP